MITQSEEIINMRMRKKKNGEERIKACADYLIGDASDASLSKMLPAELEIGCGKGRFICEKAKNNPNVNYIAVEVMTDALITALESASKDNIPNLKFINVNAKELETYFKKGDISVIYLNFSDPWHKARHYKRRLTYKAFLEVYKNILSSDGKICFKTDNRPLFDFSVEQLRENGFRVCDLTYDLHNSPFNEGNIMTEYEIKATQKEIPINSLTAYLK